MKLRLLDPDSETIRSPRWTFWRHPDDHRQSQMKQLSPDGFIRHEAESISVRKDALSCHLRVRPRNHALLILS